MLMGKVLPTATASHQLQSAGSDPRLNIFNMREKCDVACSRDLRIELTVVTLKPLRCIDGSVMSRQMMKLAQTPFS